MGQQVLNGIFLGSIYALFAVGYTLVFGVLDILNLAHQAVFMLAAFIALALVADAHLSLWVALPAAVLAGGAIGIVLERVAFRPLRGRADSNISGLISSLAMATVFEAIALQIFGPDISRFPPGTFPDRVVRIGAATASLLQLCIVGISVVLMAVLNHILARTRLGRLIRSVSGGSRAAGIVGIFVQRTCGHASDID